jgi:N-formylglutamate deformylase
MDIQYILEEKGGPVWALAIHDGHHLADELLPLMNLSEAERLREEDPYTGQLTDIGTNRLIVKTSRFQVDLNRALQDAIYLHPEQAWGLTVWKQQPPRAMIERIHHSYRYIQKLLSLVIEETIHRYGYFIIYDIHSYNSKRNGPDETVDTSLNPQINIGTIHNSSIWHPITEAFTKFVANEQFAGRSIDIRENVKFSGGYLSKWINSKYGAHGCVISIEFRKDFMDEWTGVPNHEAIESLRQLLQSSITSLKSTQMEAYGV